MSENKSILSGIGNFLNDVTNIFTNGEPSAFSDFGKETGEVGEYRSEYVLNNKALTNICDVKTVHNVYVKDNGKTSEIDVIAVTEKGIYVIESKNYSGWIFGDEDALNWTQVLPNKQKNKFYNPIKQNKTHIKKLSKALDIPEEKFTSYIVFSNRCELKKVPENKKRLNVIKRERLLWFMKYEFKHKDSLFTKEEVNKIYEKLKQFSDVTAEEKEQHIEQVKNVQAGNTCPFCNGKLVLRNGKYNKFYGCENYPNCKYTRKAR